MLTDTKIRSLRPKDKLYKVSDRDGLYVAVTKTGLISFRYDYRFNGRRETVTFGNYGPDGLSLSEAREMLNEARKLVKSGISPASQKRDLKNKRRDELNLTYYINEYMKEVKLADSTRARREAIIKKEITPVIGRYKLEEISVALLRSLCEKIRDRGGRATALLVRQIISSTFKHVINRGIDIKNPADYVKPSSIAMFEARDRVLTPNEIKIFFHELNQYGYSPSIRLAIKFILLTLVRKSELLHAKWDEIDKDKKLWVIPSNRMKKRRPLNVYLSRQAMEIIDSFEVYSMGSDLLIPGKYHNGKPLSNAALNNVIDRIVRRINDKGIDFESFTVHDLRRTGSTLLHEAGYNSDWIEKCLAHEQQNVRAVYNKAEYAEQRRKMLQEWADMVDEWIKEKD
ncbi:TPA: tyrosine-type recombinase/integrase [Proteus mirabilis]|uniref:tyrosine-type recombinase/integrase n=1 Tax=Proteus mirabilis TaxID=584 RepID=UPI00061D20B5|nr:site-specific integrase [Proteus mirabilis]KKC60938.1 integrase [Proteus mirabilis]HEK2042617.1 tyrosine-type recombinase/integrase [Proteus mirabilis]HEK2082156.1 tyrosine-type recombinase/integrase [Proteus mirabilis]